MTKATMLGTDSTDAILGAWLEGTGGISIDAKTRDNYPKHIPLAFRSLSKRKLIYSLWDEGRDFYYIDTGYIGNLGKRKDFHRVVKNNVQHLSGIKDVPADRFESICEIQPYMRYAGKRKDSGEAILVVTPSGKPCQFYNVDRDKWLAETIDEIKKHTDRPVVIRDKPARRDRVGNNSLTAQLQTENIYALVTYNSIAAVEAIHAGVPAFTLAPNAAQSLASQDLSRIENPYYPTEETVEKFLHYLAYCQYTPEELANGTAWKIQQEHQL
jgi:hypothetical protein